MYARVIILCIFETMYSVLNGFYPAKKRMAAIHMIQSAEKWGFNHQFLVTKLVVGIMSHLVSPNGSLP